MAKAKETPIKWKLVEVDKSKIRPNPNNPKIKDEEGTRKLDKLTKKFGFIYDGILNHDYSLIDGHSRLEMNPEGKGNYFMPDRQLSEEDEKELNALFDVARAGTPDMFMIEQILGQDAMNEWDGEESYGFVSGGDDAKYPLVPKYDEKHEAIVILCSNSLDTTFIKNALGIEKSMSYKNSMVKETSVVTAKNFIERWKANSK